MYNRITVVVDNGEPHLFDAVNEDEILARMNADDAI
jgi:hypothetical protein